MFDKIKKFLLLFLMTQLLPILKEALAQAAINQIQKSVYGDNYGGPRRMAQPYRSVRLPIDEEPTFKDLDD